MNKIICSHVFCEFMSETFEMQKARVSFIDNLKRENGKSLEDYLFSKHPKDYICSAFTWSVTAEGFEYWKEIDARWRNRLSSVNTK